MIYSFKGNSLKNSVLNSATLLLAGGIVFFFIAASFSIRLVGDDFWMYHELKSSGFPNFYCDFGFNIRYIGYTIMGLPVWLTSSANSFLSILPLFFVITFLAVYHAVFHFLNFLKASKIVFFEEDRPYLITIFACYICYLLTPNPQETWFWFAGTSLYLWGFVFMLHWLRYFFSSQASFLKQMLFSLLVGGCAENMAFSLVLIVVLHAFLVSTFDWKKFHLPFLLIIALSFFPIISFFSGGISARMDIQQNSLETWNEGFMLLPSKFRIISILVVCWILHHLISFSNIVWGKKFVFTYFVSISVGTFLPLFFAFHNPGPTRAWTPLLFLIVPLVLLLTTKIKVVPFRYEIVVATSLLFFVVFAYRSVQMFRYSQQFDSLITSLKKGHETNKVIDPAFFADPSVLPSVNFNSENDTLLDPPSYYFGRLLGRGQVVVFRKE